MSDTSIGLELNTFLTGLTLDFQNLNDLRPTLIVLVSMFYIKHSKTGT